MVGTETPPTTVDDDHGHQTDNDDDDDDDDDDAWGESPKPVGGAIRTSHKRKHYKAFTFDGRKFQLDDSVLLAPEESREKPSVFIIKDIFQIDFDQMMVSGLRLYRPEEVEKKEGGTWKSHDPRELFYSFKRDEVPAESVMHQCVIHFLPTPKQVPDRKQQPGFFVKEVYEHMEQKLRDVTDRDCKGALRQPAVPKQ